MIHEVTKLKIEARCEAFNKAHKRLKEVAPAIREWVKSMEGQQIFLAGGGLRKKFADTKPQLTDVWIDISGYSIRAECRDGYATRSYTNQWGKPDTIRESGGFSLYFCDLKDGVISDMARYANSEEQLRTDYDPKPVIEALEKLHEIEKQIDTITNGLHHCISARLTINHP